jgi:hypothetical protein
MDGLKPIPTSPRSYCGSCGTTEEAAEKALFSNESDKQYAAGAKAQCLFCAICGTTEVVP